MHLDIYLCRYILTSNNYESRFAKITYNFLPEGYYIK
jgi:hypothetical protein